MLLRNNTITTTHLDRHNQRFDKGTLERAAHSFNYGKYAVGIGIEHDNTIMPIGKIISGRVVEINDGEYALEAVEELFEDHECIGVCEGERWYLTKSQADNRPFADSEMEPISVAKISIDPNDYPDDIFDMLLQFFEDECGLEVGAYVRKSFTLDPQIIVEVIGGTFLYLVGKNTLKGVAEEVSNDLAKQYDNLKKAIVKAFGYVVRGDRTVTYVFRENGSFVQEFIVRTNSLDVLIRAFQQEKMLSIHEMINSFNERFSFGIAKIQSIYDTDNKRWEINYALTNKGDAIGSEKCYKKTVELKRKYLDSIESISSSPTAFATIVKRKSDE